MTQAALAGAHIATLPFKILQQMVHHPLTDKGIVQFKKDWEGARAAAAKAAPRPDAPRAGQPLRRSRGTAAGTSAGSRAAASVRLDSRFVSRQSVTTVG